MKFLSKELGGRIGYNDRVELVEKNNKLEALLRWSTEIMMQRAITVMRFEVVEKLSAL